MFVLCITRGLLIYLGCRERIETFEKRYKVSFQFRYRTCGGVDIILYRVLSTRRSPIEISKLVTSICHISPHLKAQIFIQSRTQQTVIKQNVSLQRQYYFNCCISSSNINSCSSIPLYSIILHSPKRNPYLEKNCFYLKFDPHNINISYRCYVCSCRPMNIISYKNMQV